jgi:uncharacterized membrane protein
MFRRLINDAKSAVASVVLKYIARASVAVPFVVAAGFAIAAITLMLIERFGAITAYWLMAGGLALIGIVAAVVVSVKEHEEEVAEEKAVQADTQAVAGEVALQAPMALLGALLSSPLGPSSALSVLRVLGRNLPLVLLLVMIGALFWPSDASETVAEADAGDRVDVVEDDEAGDRAAGKPNGADQHALY